MMQFKHVLQYIYLSASPFPGDPSALIVDSWSRLLLHLTRFNEWMIDFTTLHLDERTHNKARNPDFPTEDRFYIGSIPFFHPAQNLFFLLLSFIRPRAYTRTKLEEESTPSHLLTKRSGSDLLKELNESRRNFTSELSHDSSFRPFFLSSSSSSPLIVLNRQPSILDDPPRVLPSHNSLLNTTSVSIISRPLSPPSKLLPTLPYLFLQGPQTAS